MTNRLPFGRNKTALACKAIALLAGASLLFFALLATWPLMAEDITNESSSGPATRAILWRVSDDEGGRLWLLGSIHLADESIYPLPDSVKEAFNDSKVLAVEADMVNVDPAAIQKMMQGSAMLSPGDGLSKRLPKDLYHLAASRLRKLGIDIALLENMRPWFVAMFLTNMAAQQAGLDPKWGIEHHFIERAGDREVIEIEGIARQLEVFSDMSENLEVLFLRQALAETADALSEIRRIVEAWRAGDVEAIAKLRQQSREQHPELAALDEVLFTRRNIEMAEKITQYLASGRTHFVIVGAGHLAGEDSIIHLLKKEGLETERQ